LVCRSLESPSTSLELVAPSNNSSSSLPGRNSETPETTVGHSGALPDSFKPSPGWDGDSDIEIEQDPPDWTKNVPEDTLSRLDRLEKKRQEVLNGTHIHIVLGKRCGNLPFLYSFPFLLSRLLSIQPILYPKVP
jgi:hypothetical protein